jgi:RNA polymerase sigma-70 factor (ECF subfamily)
MECLAPTFRPNHVGCFRARPASQASKICAVSSGATTDLGDARAPRDNDAWVRALADGGPVGEAAQRDLRLVLVRGLRHILAPRGLAEDLCEDLAQESLLRIRERLEAFRGESRFTTWAMSIATRIAFDELRHKRWTDVSFDAVTADARGPLAFEPGADASREKGLLRERVLSELHAVIEHKLTAKQRTVLIAELNGMPHAEIAGALGMTRNALYKLAHDARKRVKFHLESAGLSEDEVLWVFE